MGEKNIHKKQPLHSLQSETVADIEKKIDELFIPRHKDQEKNTSEDDSLVSPSDSKPNLFYVDAHKKTEPTKTEVKTKKTTTVKTKKHIGFNKKKKESGTLKTEPTPLKDREKEKTDEPLPHFED